MIIIIIIIIVIIIITIIILMIIIIYSSQKVRGEMVTLSSARPIMTCQIQIGEQLTYHGGNQSKTRQQRQLHSRRQEQTVQQST